MHFPILMFVLALIQSEVVFSYTGNYFIEFNLQGADLPYTTTPPDAYCLVKLRLGSGQYNEIGRTSIIKSSYNPIWPQMFRTDYELGDYKSLKVEVWHKDFPRADDFLGSFSVDVNELASASNYRVSTDFLKEDYFVFSNRGSIILRHRIYKVEGGRRHSACGTTPPPSLTSWSHCHFITSSNNTESHYGSQCSIKLTLRGKKKKAILYE